MYMVCVFGEMWREGGNKERSKFIVIITTFLLHYTHMCVGEGEREGWNRVFLVCMYVLGRKGGRSYKVRLIQTYMPVIYVQIF